MQRRRTAAVLLLALALTSLTLFAWRSRATARVSLGNPLGRIALPLRAPLHLRATVLERLDAGSYAYLRLAVPGGAPRWLVTVRGRDTALHGCVDATAYARAEHFTSARLGRAFDPLLFGSSHRCP